MFKKGLSLLTTYQVRYTANGIAWLIYSILHLFSNVICRILSALTLLIALICTLTLLKKEEKEDEMAIKHIFKSKAFTLDIMYIISLIVVLYSSLGGNLVVNLDDTYGFVIAFVNLFTGVLFTWFEKVGD